MSSLIPPISRDRQHWYNAERNTAALIQSVVKFSSVDKLSGDQIWSLITLTWITMSNKGGRRAVSRNHWKRYKVPALAKLFNEKHPAVNGDLAATIDSMNLPPAVDQAAKKETGMVNFRGTWRNSSRTWCKKHCNELKGIIAAAMRFPANNQPRFDLAHQIDSLPAIKSPNDKAEIEAGRLLTPLIACLDPRSRFPILNGRESVKSVLRRLGLAHRDFRSKVKGMIGIIGRKNAFMLDVMMERVIKRAHRLPQLQPRTRQQRIHESSLRDYDEAERKAVLASRTVTYTHRHNTMTRALNRIFSRFSPVMETSPAGRSDAVLKNYDGAGRDLLIEAKPDGDKGSIRIAVGQLLDYARYRSRQPATDLALVTISQPPPQYIKLLTSIGITAMWFGDESCAQIAGGEGDSWPAVATCIG